MQEITGNNSGKEGLNRGRKAEMLGAGVDISLYR